MSLADTYHYLLLYTPVKHTLDITGPYVQISEAPVRLFNDANYNFKFRNSELEWLYKHSGLFNPERLRVSNLSSLKLAEDPLQFYGCNALNQVSRISIDKIAELRAAKLNAYTRILETTITDQGEWPDSATVSHEGVVYQNDLILRFWRKFRLWFTSHVEHLNNGSTQARLSQNGYIQPSQADIA
jgi:hypothetical protein